MYLDQRSFKRPETCLARRFRFFHLRYYAGNTGCWRDRACKSEKKNMGELREDLSQSDKLISALLPAYISIYFEKKLRLDRGTTNQSDTRFSILTRGKSEMNLSPSRRIQQRVFTVIKKSLFFHIEHLFLFIYQSNWFYSSEPSCSGVLVFVDKRKANIEEYEIKKKKKRKRRTSNFYFLSGKSTNNIL